MQHERPSAREESLQERLRLILAAIEEAPWVWNLNTGEDYYAPQWWHMLGYEPDELPSDATLWASCCHPDDTKKFDAAFSGALTSGAEEFEIDYRLRHKQGHYVSVHSRAFIQRDEGGKPVSLFGANSDVGQSKAGLSDLADSESRYREQVEWLPLGLVVIQGGRIMFANPAAVKMWGAARREDVVGTPIEARLHPHYRGTILDRFEAMVASPLPDVQRQAKYLRFDGRTIEVEMQAIPSQFRGAFAVQIGFQDITARVQTELTLRQSEDRFRTLTQLSSDWYWEQDENFRFVMISGHVGQSTGFTSHAHAGKALWELEALNLTEADWDQHRKIVQAHQKYRDFEIRRPNRQDRVHWVAISGMPVFDGQGVFRGYRGVGRDISSQKQAIDEIHRLAFYDPLTALPNRRLLLEQIKKALQLSARHNQRGALLFIDLDNFKLLNDTLGHDVGDVLLQQVARRVSDCVREADTVARLGGDEFVVLLEDLGAQELDAASQADAIGHKILKALNVPYQLAGRAHLSSPSIGITLFDGGSSGLDDLLKQADLAMYQAKAAGRNTLRFFDARMQLDVDGRVSLEADLRDGLQGGEELELYFQPIVNVEGQVLGAEALVRWQQPERGLLLPEEFIPMAEATGLILPLGRWVMQTACAQLVIWSQNTKTAHLTLAINISAREMREAGFVAQVKACLQQTGARPDRLRLEVKEGLLTQRVEEVVVKMNELQALGLGFSLDDFGTGYSSLSFLKRLPLDLLKIDQTFVRDVLTDRDDAAIARTIVALGLSLGLTVVAEGVETDAQRDFLVAHGCHAFQGHLFGKAMSGAQLELFLADPRRGPTPSS